jgi:hypothetical protein
LSRRHEVNVSWAGDGQYVRALLDPHVRRVYDAEATDCTVERKRGTPRHERFRYQLSGWRDDQRWKHSLAGFLLRRRGGRRITRRLEAAYDALEKNPRALLLPRPIAYAGEIGLQVFDLPRGRAFVEGLDGPDAPGAVDRLAHALAAVHSTSIVLDKTRPVAEELKTLRSRVERSTAPRDVVDAARPLLDRATRLIGDGPDGVGPVLRHLSLRRLLLTGERIALAEVDDVALSDPLIDVAEVAGRLCFFESQRDGDDANAVLAGRFRRAYLARRTEPAERLAAFEAAALVRLACGEAERDPEGTLPRRLLAEAEERMSRTGPECSP